MSVPLDPVIARYDALLHRHASAMQAHFVHATSIQPAVAECHVLRPYLLAAERYRETLATTALVAEAFIAAGRRLHADKALRRSLGIPSYLDELLALDSSDPKPTLIARIDGLFAPDGTIQFIEYNAQPEFVAARAIDDAFAASPIAAEFAVRDPFAVLHLDDYAVDSAFTACGGIPPVIGVPKGLDPSRDWMRAARARGARVSVAPYARYRVDGSRLVVDDETGSLPVDLVALSWRDLSAPIDEMKPILDGLRDGMVRAIDGVALGLLCSYKHILELLSDPAHASMFSAPVAAALSRHIPWTRVVRERKTSYQGGTVDLVPFLRDNRARFVLKPSGGARGEGVLIGRQTDDATWTKMLGRAVKQPYVAQEWVQGEIGVYPSSTTPGSCVTVTSDFNPFVWNGDDARGCQVRLSATGKHSPEEVLGDRGMGRRARVSVTTKRDKLTPEQRALLARRLRARAGADVEPAPLARQVGESVPLSSAQERLWFVEQNEGTPGLYNVPHAVRWRGPLDVKALEHALYELVVRHEVLRSRFELTEHGAVQRSFPPAITLEQIDLGDRELETVQRDVSVQPFDLTRASFPRRARTYRTSGPPAPARDAPRGHRRLECTHSPRRAVRALSRGRQWRVEPASPPQAHVRRLRGMAAAPPRQRPLRDRPRLLERGAPRCTARARAAARSLSLGATDLSRCRPQVLPAGRPHERGQSARARRERNARQCLTGSIHGVARQLRRSARHRRGHADGKPHAR